MAKDVKLVEGVNALPINAFWAEHFPQSRLDALQNEIQTQLDKRITLRVSSAEELKTRHKVLRDQCFRLIESNAAQDYKNSEIKWSPSSKRREMLLPDMRYLLVLQDSDRDKVLDGHAGGTATSDVLGFISFMITYEDGHEVVYVYEIHLKAEIQGQGLGTTLIKNVEEIGRRVGVEKIMLTVFKANDKAVKWYSKNGYTQDEYSPGPRVLRNGRVKPVSYMILSKTLNQKGRQES